jgi:hypothetical protein
LYPGFIEEKAWKAKPSEFLIMLLVYRGRSSNYGGRSNR